MGIVGTASHASGVPHTTPVPRGPKSHLWVPAMKKSQPRSSTVTSSTPSPWTPSTHSSARRPSRSRSRSASAAAIAAIGSFTPVPEWTHVTATTRVAGVTAAMRRSTILGGRPAGSS